ncbi:hypothetical protein A9Q79_06420 [Methylophaga sp. 42_25_T18]|nr:hypothetical protein A9Q79_06420 [Methylophaga sp. 42_25_T18]OUR85967.1 hypothetical protein A9Q92_06860 [Methylophaga sp. 42_8_T64]
MKQLFTQSVQLLNAHLGWVLFVGICNTQLLSGEIASNLSLLGIIVSFIMGIIIYGRIIAQIQGRDALPAFKIFKENWFNYIIVTMLLGLPLFLYAQLSKLFPIPVEFSIFGKEAIRALINTLAIYVLPLVFIKRLHLLAILAGIVFLIQNFKKSIPIIFMIVCMFFIYAAMWFWLMQQTQSDISLFSLLPVMALVNISVSYLTFLIFTAASLVLVAMPLTKSKPRL